MTNMTNWPNSSLISAHGGYRDLKSFQSAKIVFDLTVHFCDLYIEKGSRTHDQMVQAVCSGKQNIAEASQASGTSKKTEIKLLNVARASFEELLQDFENFMRLNNLPIWDKNDPRIMKIRESAYLPKRSYLTYKANLSNPEVSANLIICLIHQTNFLLDRQLKFLAKDFLEKAGFTERLYHSRKNFRSKCD